MLRTHCRRFFSRCYFATHGLQGFAYFSTIARFDDLALGGLAATFIGQRTLLPRRALITGITLFLVTAFCSRGFEVHKRLVITVGTAAVGMAFFGLVMMASLKQWAWLRRREPTSAGKYSYGIYVFHFPLVIWAGSTNSLLLLLATIPASLLLAYVSYHAFEKHFLALKRYVKYGGTRHALKRQKHPAGKACFLSGKRENAELINRPRPILFYQTK